MVEMWARGAAYEAYIGRWSRVVAAPFVRGLRVPPGAAWLDVGCGTGALTAAVLGLARPGRVAGVDPSAAFLRDADARALRVAADARALPFPAARFDAVVSGLALNFVPEPERAAAELARVVAPGGTVAAYLWDYAGGMQMLAHFWAAAVELDPGVADRDEVRRFPLCRPEPLHALFTGAGLTGVTTGEIVAPTPFADVADYWRPFLGGQGPAPAYVAGLSPAGRAALRDRVAARLPVAADGSIALTARAWVVRGVRPS
ncbi:class I SAM-dependent methyltransferase [Spirilliplanes yamanashiensis]|uniref:Methyltransferase n=1 Tax=Spirilliplanes yamanashiensis TaxID=42233 RepID=A0A8J3Y5P6_9ACTN|nr:class I SAM-dependent methyltransferase [Spirilliplanes yamanashiensis]MDP9819345.1 SAM-dependent methyltransferase [Spirilliplanes yamanashiensis]GIJ01832.1 methyltransferase [Spirilliplanes yamanashiensis]